MAPGWRVFGDVLGVAFPASHAQHISDLNPKFALGPHHVWKYGRDPICDGSDEIRRGKKKIDRQKKKKPQDENIMACPIP